MVLLFYRSCHDTSPVPYKAGNWIRVGETKGRGKLGPMGKISVPIKDI
jgi:hypothetical protein